MTKEYKNGETGKPAEQIDCRGRMIALYQSSEYQELNAFYAKKSAFSILGIARREEQHSNMIAWLLNPKGGHGFGKKPMRCFLQLLAIAKRNYPAINRDSFLPDGLLDTFITGNFDIKSAEIEREVAIAIGGTTRFIDLLLSVGLVVDDETKVLPIVIENKVESDEHSEQTKIYHAWATKKYGDCMNCMQPLFVFLSPDGFHELETGRGEITPCSCTQYIRINYQGLVDHVITPCLKENMADDIRFFIKDYLRCLSFEALTNDERKSKMTMAYSDDEKRLLHAFWDKNKDLLKAVMYALSEDEAIDLDEDERRQMRALSQKLPSSKDKTKYQIDGQGGVLNKRKLVLAVVKRFVQGNEGVAFEKLKEAFPDALQRTYGVVQKRADLPENSMDRYFVNDAITLADGTEVVVCNQWGIGNIGEFVSRARQLGYEIREL